MIVLKLAGARARKRAREGRCEGRKPFGYYEGEATAVERIQALRNEGLGFDRIARQLNSEGIPTRTAVARFRRQLHSRRSCALRWDLALCRVLVACPRGY